MIFTDGIVYVDDFFSAEAIAALEGGSYDTTMIHHEHEFGRVKTEMHCDIVDEELWSFMNDHELAMAIRDVYDLSWRVVFNGLLATDNYSAISRYRPGVGMRWHCDHWNGHVLNWIVTLEGDSHIKWCFDAFPKALPEIFAPKMTPLSIDLEPNRLILMPSYYPHKIIMDEEERVSVHGHFKT